MTTESLNHSFPIPRLALPHTKYGCTGDVTGRRRHALYVDQHAVTCISRPRERSA
jgi:hypothetical protein